MEIKFKILGKPRGKQRPRMCVRFGKQITYTPKQTSEYGSQCATPSGRCRRANEQEKAQRIANRNKQGDNVFDREVRKTPITTKKSGRIITEIGLKKVANTITKMITESMPHDEKSKK